MTHAVIAGSLQKPAEQRTGKNGGSYITGAIIETIGTEKRWWRFVAFDEASVAALVALQAGEAVAVSGEISAEIYAAEGREARVSWSIKVSCVLTAQAKPKPSASGRDTAERPLAAPDQSGKPVHPKYGDTLDDPIPFAPARRLP